jgi:hypothetical protein
MSILADVDRGLAIRGEMDALKKELGEIEERLEAAGLKGEQIDLVDADREGKQFLAKGTKQIVPVVFTADLLIKSFKFPSAHYTRITSAIPEGFAESSAQGLGGFFTRSVVYESRTDSGKKFRAIAGELLGKDAPKFITACLARDKEGIPKSAIKIEWDRASEVAA